MSNNKKSSYYGSYTKQINVDIYWAPSNDNTNWDLSIFENGSLVNTVRSENDIFAKKLALFKDRLLNGESFESVSKDIVEFLAI